MAFGNYFFDSVERLMNDALDRRLPLRLEGRLDERDSVPHHAMDVVEKDNSYEVHADVPGLEPSNVTVEVKDNRLCISGERKEEQKEETANYLKMERKHSSFSRSFGLPDDADTEKVEANMDKGVLTVCIGKKDKQDTSAKRIEVKSAS